MRFEMASEDRIQLRGLCRSVTPTHGWHCAFVQHAVSLIGYSIRARLAYPPNDNLPSLCPHCRVDCCLTLPRHITTTVVRRCSNFVDMAKTQLRRANNSPTAMGRTPVASTPFGTDMRRFHDQTSSRASRRRRH